MLRPTKIVSFNMEDNTIAAETLDVKSYDSVDILKSYI